MKKDVEFDIRVFANGKDLGIIDSFDYGDLEDDKPFGRLGEYVWEAILDTVYSYLQEDDRYVTENRNRSISATKTPQGIMEKIISQ